MFLPPCSSVLFALVKSEVSTAGIDSTIVVTDPERSPLLSPVSWFVLSMSLKFVLYYLALKK